MGKNMEPLSQTELYQFLAPLLPGKSSGKKSKNFKGHGPEDKITMDIVNFLVGGSIDGELKFVWFHPANEISRADNPIYGQYLKKLGKIKGAPDFVFVWSGGGGFIEVKSPKGRMSPSQEIFQRWCITFGIPYEVVRSLDEAKKVLQTWGLAK